MAGITGHFKAVFSHDDRHLDRIALFQTQLLPGDSQLQNGVGIDRPIGTNFLPSILVGLARQEKCARTRRGKRKRKPKRELRPLHSNVDVEALSCRARFVRIESHHEVIQVPAELDRSEESISFPHGAKRGPGINASRAAPFEKVGHHAVDCRIQQDERLLDRIGFRGDGLGRDRVVQLIGRRNAHMCPDIAKMRTKEAIEFRFEIGIEIVAVPPEPIAAFGGVQFVPGRSRAIRRKTRRDIHKLCAGVTEEIPSMIVFVVPDPNLVIGIDPGA